MKPFNERAREYTFLLPHPVSRYLNMAGVFIMVLSFFIFLGFIHIVVPGLIDIKIADLACLGLLVFFFLLEWRLAMIVTPLLLILLWIAHFFDPDAASFWSFIALALIGIVLQLIEPLRAGRRLVLAESLWLAITAPLIAAAEILFMAGKMEALHHTMYGDTLPPRNEEKK